MQSSVSVSKRYTSIVGLPINLQISNTLHQAHEALTDT